VRASDFGFEYDKSLGKKLCLTIHRVISVKMPMGMHLEAAETRHVQ